MPPLVMFAINMALKMGLRWLEASPRAGVLLIIEDVLKFIEQAPSQSQGIELARNHIGKLTATNIATAPDTVK